MPTMQYELFAAAATSPAQRVPCLQREIPRELMSRGEGYLQPTPTQHPKNSSEARAGEESAPRAGQPLFKTHSKDWGMEEINAESNLLFAFCT